MNISASPSTDVELGFIKVQGKVTLDKLYIEVIIIKILIKSNTLFQELKAASDL